MRTISPDEVRERTLARLGLPDVNFSSVALFAGALRRAAAFVCPCPRRTLLTTVQDSLAGLLPEDEGKLRERLDDVLDALVAHGDLLESGDVATQNVSSDRIMLLYAAPLSYVWRKGGSAILLGISPDNELPFDPVLRGRIDFRNHVRRITQRPGEDLRLLLNQGGLREMSAEAWIKAPPRETYSHHLDRMDAELEALVGQLADLLLLDPEEPVTYYRGRWRGPKSTDTGRFVARRPQQYGNSLWCYVELAGGVPVRILDFPAKSSRYRGCDDAWYLQLAIDARNGHPQQYALSPSTGDRWLLECFSPVPMWAQRHWDAIGETTSGGRGTLFAYTIDNSDIEDERRFLAEHLWLAPRAV